MRGLTCLRTTIAVAWVLTCASLAWASSAGFVIRAEGAELGKLDEGTDIPKVHLKLNRGQTVTLIAQGMAYPRGAAPSPHEPEAGTWLFDDEVFRLQAHDRKKYDRTMVPVRLMAAKVGTARIRFTGIVLGYERRYDVIVEVVEPKK